MSVTEVADAELGLSVTEAARRAQIIGAAIDVIAEVGYSKATFARIVERAGLSSTRMISYHFTNRDELVMRVVGAVIDSMDTFLAGRLDTDGGRMRMLRDYIGAEVAYLGEHPTKVQALLTIGAHTREQSGSPIVDAVWRDIRTGRLERQLTQGQREGVFGEFDVAVMAMAIRQAIDGVALRLAGDPGLDLELYGAEIADLFERATTS